MITASGHTEISRGKNLEFSKWIIKVAAAAIATSLNTGALNAKVYHARKNSTD
jgi:hypothetical protein